MRNLKLVLTLGIVSLTACQAPTGSTLNSSAPNSTPASTGVTQTVSLPVVDPTSPSNIPLTYYKKSVTVSPANVGGRTYTATGYCVVYNSATYCWDDGVRTIQYQIGNTVYGPYNYTYWLLSVSGNTWGPCSAGCNVDLMPAPTVIDSRLTLNFPSGTTVAGVLAGTPVSVNCAMGNGLLNCVDFVIDLNQSPL